MNSWKYWIASITDTCNNRCPGCYRGLQGSLCWQESHMTLADFEKILKLFVDQEGVSIDFVGGEPTLHPDFFRMVELCVAAEIKIWIYTNLRRFNRVELATQLQALGGDITVVGKLNVPNPEDPTQKRLQAQFIGSSELTVDEMWQGLQNLLKVGFPAGKIGVENLVRNININLAPAVYETGLRMGFFVDLEIPTCPFTASLTSFQQWLKLLPSRTKILRCIKGLAEVNQRYSISPYTPMLPHLTGRNPEGVGIGCVAFKQGALLTDVDGQVALCTSGIPLVGEKNQPLNILIDPLEAIFQHPDLVARRQSCLQENISSGPCKTCTHWRYCLGGCAALRESLGSIFDSYPLCYMHEWPTKQELLRLFLKSRGG